MIDCGAGQRSPDPPTAEFSAFGANCGGHFKTVMVGRKVGGGGGGRNEKKKKKKEPGPTIKFACKEIIYFNCLILSKHVGACAFSPPPPPPQSSPPARCLHCPLILSTNDVLVCTVP